MNLVLVQWEPDTPDSFLKSCGLLTKPWTHVLAGLALASGPGGPSLQRAHRLPVGKYEKLGRPRDVFAGPFISLGVEAAAGSLTRGTGIGV